ncbi:MAG: NAD-binding protein, partial [Deltaproteobacteria bacterium]|nr:NAD-binding protein [Deltaproteobacteria bacterium]
VQGADNPKVINAEKLHNMLKFMLKFFSSAQLEKLSKLWMPVGKSVVIMGGTLHGCELAEYLVKRRRRVTMVHNGPEKELGDRMTIDDIVSLWPCLIQNNATIWSDVEYNSISNNGLTISLKDKRKYILRGKNIISTQDWEPDNSIAERFKGLAPELHIIGSCREPGLIVDAIKDGAKIGCEI